jgi:RNA recognition motif-containing protein
VKETQSFLRQSNVKPENTSHSSFSREPMDVEQRRSDTTIIVKNLPSGVETEELKAAFARFGRVADVKISPGKPVRTVYNMIEIE